jgi:hypothetical protein
MDHGASEHNLLLECLDLMRKKLSKLFSMCFRLRKKHLKPKNPRGKAWVDYGASEHDLLSECFDLMRKKCFK